MDIIDNDMILELFERLFKLIEFKESFKCLRIIVDNATTHTAKNYSISDFIKKTKCSTEKIEWKENGKSLDCFHKNGVSKGLFQKAKELKLIPKNSNDKNKLYQ